MVTYKIRKGTTSSIEHYAEQKLENQNVVDFRRCIGGIMFDEFRMKLKFYLWLMGWSLNSAWAWRKQAKMIEDNNRKEEEDYLKELKKKL